MILVVAGTQDGREAAHCLAAAGYSVLVSVATKYGRLLAEDGLCRLVDGKLDTDGFTELFQRENITCIVDASHPYANQVSQEVFSAAVRMGISYVRYERKGEALPSYDKLRTAADAQAAARIAAELGETIFLTTGSRTLAAYKQEPLLASKRLIARILPDKEVLGQALALGFLPRDIVAMQGPFSEALNSAMFRQYGTDVVVTKNSGLIGGTDTKFSAAVNLGLWLVVIDRPQDAAESKVYSLSELLAWIRRAII